jgi:hypothetical protein
MPRRSRSPPCLQRELFSLADKKGYTVEDALAKGRHRLRFDLTEELATRETGSAS